MTKRLLAFLGSVFLVAGPVQAQTEPPPEYRDLARSIFAQLIEINTTDSERGNNTDAARAVAQRLLDAGFPEEDVRVLVPADSPTKGNLVARYRGRDTGKKAVLLLAHIDVVEALPEDWSPDLDPFEFLEREGFFYGRGVTDNKDEAAIYTANFIRMKQEGFVPDRDIIVALTADEEGGPRNGVQFLLEEHRDLIDADFALNEGGGGMEQDGRRISNNVQASEKKYLSFYFDGSNPGGHSSLPVKKNAIYDLSQALLAVQAHDFPVMLNEVTEAFFTRSADLVGGSMGEARVQLPATDHVRGHAPRRGPRAERSSAGGAGHGELPDSAGPRPCDRSSHASGSCRAVRRHGDAGWQRDAQPAIPPHG
jgi:acetylornithine deacetylase/succinyl-diaminopimelate desuccinylase-like protein